MRGRGGVRVGQPGVERHESGLDAETGEAREQDDRERFGVVGRVACEVLEVPTARQLMQREETDVEQNTPACVATKYQKPPRRTSALSLSKTIEK